jgi:lysophospholipase L1-like esterase
MNTPSIPPWRLLGALGLVLLVSACATDSTAPSKTAAAPEPAPLMVAPPPATTVDGFVQSTTTAAPPGPRPNPDIVPAIQRGTDNRHAAFLARIKQGPIDLLFLGDSITDFWNTRGKAVWDKYYGALNAADFGINADRTQNVLWRLQNGEGQGFAPKVVVLMIGTNNIGVTRRGTPDSPWRGTSAEAVEGVTAVVAELRKDFPAAKVLLLGIFPRGDDLLAMQQIPEVNRGLSKLDDQTHVFYLDIGPKFLGPDGQINLALFQAADHLHPSPAGYTVWAEAMNDLLTKLLR